MFEGTILGDTVEVKLNMDSCPDSLVVVFEIPWNAATKIYSFN